MSHRPLCKARQRWTCHEPAEGALAQPTRAQIFAFLVERRGPAGTEEIAERFGLHPNGMRRHLERLEEGGFVDPRPDREGRAARATTGRSPPTPTPAGRRPHAYADLARWLARAIPADPAGCARSSGPAGRSAVSWRRRRPRIRSSSSATRSPRSASSRSSTSKPTAASPAHSRTAPTATRCARPGVVCGLHRGITIGILAELDPEAELVRFEPADPERAGCLVEVVESGR